MLRLYWARNDGLGGHVFLGLDDLRALAAEMAEQGMTGWVALERLEPGQHVPPGAVDFALSQASTEPSVLADVTGSRFSRARPKTAASSSASVLEGR